MQSKTDGDTIIARQFRVTADAIHAALRLLPEAPEDERVDSVRAEGALAASLNFVDALGGMQRGDPRRAVHWAVALDLTGAALHHLAHHVSPGTVHLAVQAQGAMEATIVLLNQLADEIECSAPSHSPRLRRLVHFD